MGSIRFVFRPPECGCHVASVARCRPAVTVAGRLGGDPKPPQGRQAESFREMPNGLTLRRSVNPVKLFQRRSM